VIYVVQTGDTLSSIASRYDTTVGALRATNALSEDHILRVGEKLIIPGSGGQGGEVEIPTPVVLTSTYEVEPGDTLLGIASRFHVDVDELILVNKVEDPARLQAGQELIIPLGTPTPEPTATPEPSATPTPGPPYAAPALLSPPDGEVFTGSDAQVVLSWASVGVLKDDEWYVVRLWRGEGETKRLAADPVWTRATAWTVPSALWPGQETADSESVFHWDVTVMRRTGGGGEFGIAAASEEGEAQSTASEVRSFVWR